MKNLHPNTARIMNGLQNQQKVIKELTDEQIIANGIAKIEDLEKNPDKVRAALRERGWYMP